MSRLPARPAAATRTRRLLAALACSTLALASCQTDRQGPSGEAADLDAACSIAAPVWDPEHPATEQLRAHSPQGSFMAATTHPRATQAACTVLAQGGTAADGLVAAQAVLGLVEPQSSGPGGGALVTYRDAASGKVSSFDATVHTLDKDSSVSGDASSNLRSVGVPQTMRLLASLNAQLGHKPLSELVGPAVRLGRDGFEASDRLAQAMNSNQRPFRKGQPGAVLRNKDGKRPNAGDILHNEPYADFLERWAAQPQLSPEFVTDADKQIRDQSDGKHYAQQLAAAWAEQSAQPIEAAPALCTRALGAHVCGPGSTATGMMVTAETLNIVDKLDISRLEPYTDGDTPVARSTAAHLISEAERVAFADANTWMGDPSVNPERAAAYVDQVITDSAYAQSRSEDIGQGRAQESIAPAVLDGFDAQGYREFEEEGTAQISVMDKSGNVASMTTTLQRNFGSGIMVDGFFLNNSLDNFTADAHEGQPNARQDATRPKTLMNPVIMEGPGAKVTALGSPGGRKIPSYNLKNIVAIAGWGLSPDAAIAMPNFGATGRTQVYAESQTGPTSGGRDLQHQGLLQSNLEEWGQEVSVDTADSGAGIVQSDADGLSGGADARRGGAVVGG
ncbi:gamma-glutamyltransferase [Corynebacterium uberis]|uniref:gamma-glutamyltransferase n=1 Tax=Corynebacterium TaxID=1716 RepID=UPI001D0B9337|nr:gamma-glutamyltransferase [Corynebacterium uberis]MCZ9308429.1 gamma-glutamyltransferase [Corynebacterium sp. c6VSa_13]UDL74096.1 gamma-glutamyltransferase [Corynebacterium uberis]UDL75020.1 gamma-glutamyltransferase [Corynebacterium uberis]UDL77235.1 gamma-glutamyltransferase [Corynebacterium uberis]UDL79517.1 gamma-glutamyltransferase [Corynebacterium uberis]